MKLPRLFLFAVCAAGTSLQADVPQMIHVQGRVTVNGTPFAGPTGSFGFALVNSDGTTTYWSNDGTSTAGSQPTAAVVLPVNKGLYSALLGDSSIGGGMTQPIVASVFANNDVRLRVWFDDGVNGFQLLSPDQRIAAVGYALVAQEASTVAAGAVTSGSIANGAVGSAQLASSLSISGTLSAGNFSGNGAGLNGVPGTVPWQVVAGTAQLAEPNSGYIANAPAQVTITLPAAPSVGDVVAVSGAGSGGWKVAENANQSIIGFGAGAAWTPRESNRSWDSVASSADGTKLVALEHLGQIYTSTNSGVTWTPRETNRDWSSVASSADGTKLVGTVFRGQIYTSTNSGVTWIPRESNRIWWAVASSADGTKLVAMVYDGQIYTSTDSGVTWTPRETNRDWWSVASSADGTKLVAVGYRFGRIYTSTNSGATWTARESFRDWRTVASSADGTRLVAGVVNGRIYTSADSGSNWTPRENSRWWQAVASSADGTKLVAAVKGGSIYTSVLSYPTGGQATATELQYAGNGQWLPLVPSTFTGDVTIASPGTLSFGSTWRQMLNLWDTAYGAGVQDHTLYFRTGPGADFAWYKGGDHSDTHDTPGTGGSTLMLLNGSGLTVNGTLVSSSDRAAKQGFSPVDARAVLDKVAALPLTTWSYKTDAGTRHIGPMAQDFHAAFQVGPDDKHIATVDEGGVALAAIQGLNQKLEEKDAELRQLQERIAKLEGMFTPLTRPSNGGKR